MRFLFILLASFLLLFNAVGALYGGWNLIIHPDGSSIQLSLNWLKHTPFQNYLVPGIILFAANGLFSLFVFLSVLFRMRKYFWFIMVQGAVLFGWIIIQILLVQTVYFLHYIMGSVGPLLIITGYLLYRIDRN